MMFRIGRMRSAHRKASADELLIGFCLFCLNSATHLWAPPSSRAGQSPGLPWSSNPKGRNSPKIPGRVGPPGPLAKKKGAAREMAG